MSEKSESSGTNQHRAPNFDLHAVAWFDSIAEVRAATVALEQHGIDSMYIDFARHDSVVDRVQVDRKSIGWMGSRAVIGLCLGALAGLVAGLAIAALAGAEGVEFVAITLCAVIFCAPLGAYWTVASRLPVTDEAFDTFGQEPEGGDWISVGGPAEVQRSAVVVLRKLKPLRLTESGAGR